MLKTTKPDYVIVTTVDATHDEFIVKALNMGVNVITEKPMTTDEVKCKRILDAEKKSGKKVIVAFNYRHSVHTMQVKELLAPNRVGKIISVDFNWYLNVHHGVRLFPPLAWPRWLRADHCGCIRPHTILTSSTGG